MDEYRKTPSKFATEIVCMQNQTILFFMAESSHAVQERRWGLLYLIKQVQTNNLIIRDISIPM